MIKVGVADFREHEFEHIRKFVPDGDQLFPTWAEQQIELEKTIGRFRNEGIIAVPVVLTLAALMKYEVDHGVRPDGGERARMASELVWGR